MTNDRKVRAAEVTAAWLANPNTRIAPHDVPRALSAIHSALSALGKPAEDATSVAPIRYKRAVGAAASLRIVGRIISMIDGRPYTSLTRHLKKHGLTAEQYRERYRLKPDYPIVAPAYSDARRAMAKKLWHGRITGMDVSDRS